MKHIHPSVFLAEGCRVSGDVEIGKDSSVWYNAVIRGNPAKITIGERTNVQDGAILHAKIGRPLTIGDGVTIGHGAIVHCDAVGDNTLIGMGAVIQEETVIGKDCIIGAGALITRRKIIPDGSMVYGSPAKIIRPLTPEEIEGNRDSAEEYLEFTRAERAEDSESMTAAPAGD